MIGHYLLTLTAEQETRVLTQRLAAAPHGCVNKNGTRCLLGVCHDVGGPAADNRENGILMVGVRFDKLCRRFGEHRINAAVRNRVLTNQARRTLTGVTVGVRVPHHETQTSKGDS